MTTQEIANEVETILSFDDNLTDSQREALCLSLEIFKRYEVAKYYVEVWYEPNMKDNMGMIVKRMAGTLKGVLNGEIPMPTAHRPSYGEERIKL